MKTVIIAMALLIMLPSLGAARGGGGGGHAGHAGGLIGFPVVIHGGIHGFGHQGAFGGAHVADGRIHDGVTVGRNARNFRLVSSPPLIIERRGIGFERIGANQAFTGTGPLIIERQGDVFVRVH